MEQDIRNKSVKNPNNDGQLVNSIKNDRIHYVKVAYALGGVGFCVSRKAVERMAELGSPEAKSLLETTADEYRDSYHAGKYPISIHNFSNEYSHYFYYHRDDPILVRAIEELGVESGEPGSCMRIANLNLLPGQTYKVKMIDSAMAWDIDQEWIEIV